MKQPNLINQSREHNAITRRRFLGGSLAAASIAGLKTSGLSYSKTRLSEQESGIKEFRTLGRTGFKVSDIAFGSAELTEPSLLEVCIREGLSETLGGAWADGGYREDEKMAAAELEAHYGDANWTWRF